MTNIPCLGRRAPSNKPAIMAGPLLTPVSGPLPNYTPDDAPPELVFPMDGNDRWGDCVVAGLDHGLQVIDYLLGVPRPNWTLDQIQSYYRTQNPTFNPATGAGDDGMDIQTFLSLLVKEGVLLGFGKLDPTNEAEMDAATYIGLAIITGENLDVAQQSERVWDYVPGSPSWGGHCTTTVGYARTPDVKKVVTWGKLISVTEKFVEHQLEEAWFIVTQAHVDHPTFRNNFDLAGFAEAYTEITGRQFPVDVPPAPTPGPTPVPSSFSPFAGLEEALTSNTALTNRLARAGTRHHPPMKPTDYALWKLSQ